MKITRWTTSVLAGAGAAALCVGVLTSLGGQPPAQAPGGGGRGGGRGGAAMNVFTAADANKDGFVTKDELQQTLAKWWTDADTAKAGSVTAAQLGGAINAAFPAPAIPAFVGG